MFCKILFQYKLFILVSGDSIAVFEVVLVAYVRACVRVCVCVCVCVCVGGGGGFRYDIIF